MSVPLHIRIAEKLRHQIEAEDYPPGEKLPSEHQLMEQFQVSRITVRQAIANLVSQGLVQSQQGKGVFVSPRKKVAYNLSPPLLFLEQDMERKGIEFTFENLSFRKVRSPKGVKMALRLADTSMVYCQKKLLRMDGSVGAVDISYILLELGQQLGSELKRQMTFPTLEAHGMPIDHIDAVVECTHANYELSEYLNATLGQPLIVYCYTAYIEKDRPILYGETISRADHFCYSFRLQRTLPKNPPSDHP
ncbi:MAG: GntR family transcriptional regulator [Cyanobacteria bacterium P01_F01_bin.150]